MFLSPSLRSPECVEDEFCELRLTEFLGSPHARCGIEGPGRWRKAMLPRPSHNGGRRLRVSPIPLQAAIKAQPLCEENAHLRHMQRMSESYGTVQSRRATLAYIPP